MLGSLGYRFPMALFHGVLMRCQPSMIGVLIHVNYCRHPRSTGRL